MTIELLMIRAMERGLSLYDFRDMTFGMIVDFIITYNNLHFHEKENKEKMAGQNDFDSF